jgi:hypothetical protein
MALKTLLMAALLGVAISNDCFDYSCESLGSTICAKKYNSTTIYVTNDGCDCTVTDYALTILEYSDIGETINCTTDHFTYSHTYYNNSYYDTFNCSTRNTNVELASGSYPKTCNSTSDCLLKDGKYNDCSCAYDGNSYCVPDLSSSEYDDYWTGCDDNDGDEIVYGLFYQAVYPLQVNSPSCTDDVVYELITLSNYDDDRSSAVALAFSVIGALAVLY